MSDFERLARDQQHRPAGTIAAAAVAAPPVQVDVRPLQIAAGLLRAYSYLRQDGVKVWIEGKAGRSTPVKELVERYGRLDGGYLRGANRVLSTTAVEPSREFVSAASCLSFAETGLALSEVATNYKVGLASFDLPADPGAFEATAPVGTIDLLCYDWQRRGYVPVSFESSPLHRSDPEPFFLSHAALVRLHLSAFLLLRMFEEQREEGGRIAYLLFVGYLSNDRRLCAWRVDYDPKKYLGEALPGRQPMLASEFK